MTDWSPETCGCTIRVTDWDNVIGQTIVACPAHAGLKDNAHFQQVYKSENQIKNLLLGHIQQNFPNALGSSTCKYCSPYGVSAHLSFDANRNISLKTSNWQQADIIAVKSHCDLTYGVGKVTVS